MQKKALIDRIIKLGIYIFVFLLPWQTRLIFRPGEIGGGYSEYLTVSLYAVDILLIGLVILGAAADRTDGIDKANRGYFGGPGLVWVVFLGWSALSVIWAPDRLLSLQTVSRLVLATGFVWLAKASKIGWRTLAWSFLLGLTIPAALAIFQFYNQIAPANKWLGLAAHAPYDLGQSVIETADGGRWLRAYGSFDHPNILGSTMVFALVAVFFLALEEPNRLRRAVVLALSPLFLFALFFSFSRSAWLVLGFGLTYLLAYFAIAKAHLAQKHLLYFILMIGIQVFILFDSTSELALTRLDAKARLEYKSLAERSVSYREGWEAIKRNPAFGAGAGNFVKELSGKQPGNPAFYYQPVHSTYLLAWSEYGIVGFILIFIFVLQWTKKGKKEPYFVLFIMVCLLFFFDHWWLSLHFGIVLSALIACLFIVKINKVS